MLPIIHLAIESPTHSIVDASLRSLPTILPVLDFSTIKNELFPVIASVFTKTSSLAIKVRGLEAFVILCGGSNDPAGSNDGLDGIIANTKKTSSSTALDKYTMQEKIVPLIRAIKTKEPAVAMAALNVLRQVGTIADADFVAMDILPVLWSMSLGPLLDLKQFQAFMDLIKSLSARVEAEQTKKLQELSGTNGSKKDNDDFMSFGATNAFSTNGGSNDPEIDFERLVKGTAGISESTNPLDGGWDAMPANATGHQRNTSNQTKPASFAWSTPSPTTPSMPGNSMGVLRPQGPTARTITPDLSRFDTLSPSATQYSHPLQPQPQQSFNAPLQPQPNYNATPLQPQPISGFQSPPTSTSMNWGTPASNPWSTSSTPVANTGLSSIGNLGNSMSNMSMNQRPTMNTPNSFSLPPPPGQRPIIGSPNSFSLPPPPGATSFTPPSYQAPQQSSTASAFGNPAQAKPPAQKSGLDAYQSLL
jgi:SCY1-like protein 2